MTVLLLLVFVPLLVLLASSLPIGVWALAVLMRSDIRQAFDIDPAKRAG